jgi:anoctamin-10/anoctamin-7
VDRADFRGDVIQSFIDGSEVRYFSSKKRKALLWQSIMGVVTLVFLVVGVVVGIYLLRYAVSGDIGDSNAQTVASIANAVQIQVVNYIYSFIANALSERENHRTDTQFEDTMIAKIFWFQFVNSYASFFYLAFIAESVGDCPDEGCMSVLTINLAIIFLVRLLSGNAMEILLPYLSYKFKYVKLIAMHWGKISRPEAEARLEKYDLMSSSIEDYAEVAIQYGYTALFVTALPMAAACAYVSNLVEMKGDVWKLLNLHQRPFPKGAEDIGTWQTIFLIISMAAVVTNAALTVFTMDTLDDYSFGLRMWIFIGFQWACFTLQVS